MHLETLNRNPIAYPYRTPVHLTPVYLCTCNGGRRLKNSSPPSPSPQKSEPIKKIALVALASDQYCCPRWRIAPSTDLVLAPARRETSIFLIVGPCIFLIVGPRPIFGYLMITYSFPMVLLCFCYVSG